MRNRNRYVMYDQVRGLVPELMTFDSIGQPRRPLSWWQLLAFGGAVVAYLGALALTA